MSATLMQLRRLTRSRLGIPVTDDFFTDPVLDDHINLAVQAIESEQRWPWSEVVETVTVTPAEPDIPLEEGWRATRSIFDGEVELHLVAPADLLSWSATVGAPPRVFCPIRDVVAVRPLVASPTVLTHYWYRMSVWLRDDTDVPDIPEQFAGAIVAKAAELLAARESSGSDASRHQVEYGAWITRMRRDVRRTTTPTRPRVRPGGWI